MLLHIILSKDDIRRVTLDNLPETVDTFLPSVAALIKNKKINELCHTNLSHTKQTFTGSLKHTQIHTQPIVIDLCLHYNDTCTQTNSVQLIANDVCVQ